MKRNLAESIVNSILSVNETIGAIDSVVSQISDDNERNHYIFAIGILLKTTREEFLLRLFNDYPELNPYDK